MKREITLEKLTPIMLDEKQKERLGYANYEKVINDAMESEDVCNIALTGAYGAGKSTIMNTWLHDHSDLKCIHISLAKFDNTGGGKTEDGGTGGGKTGDGGTDSVETKIINQIIHQIKPEVIPQTRFQRKHIVSRWKVFGCTLLIFVLLVSVLYLFRVPSAQWDKNTGITLYESFRKYRENFVMLGAALGSAFALLLCIVNAQYKRPIIKTIQVDKSQIDLVSAENGKSEEKFDKYMEEIIYLFRKSDVDALIIEDLDRYDGVEIFNELRQINFLLNQRQLGTKKYGFRKKKGYKKIKFIYLVKDELFRDSGERTKFFDIMIPVVPVMDHSNSYELLKEMLGEEWQAVLDMDYLKTICLYVKDFRILKNIYNEFVLYYAQIKAEKYGINATRLFAVITYKNIAPIDFALLQRGEGKVWNCFRQAEDERRQRVKELTREIERLERQIADIQGELAADTDELDAIFFEDEKGNGDLGCYVIDGKSEHAYQTRREMVHALKEAGKIEWQYDGNALKDVTKEVKEKLRSLDKDDEYKRRSAVLAARSEGKAERLQEEIQKKREELAACGEASLQSLLELSEEKTAETLFGAFDRGERLIPVLMRDGMIAEDYATYMTYFYPNSISEEEYVYLNRVFERKSDAGQKDIPILHPELVLGHLKSSDFLSVALPNTSLYLYLLASGPEEQLELAAENLARYQNIDFMLEILERAKAAEQLEEENLERKWVAVVLRVWKNLGRAFAAGMQSNTYETLDRITGFLPHLTDEEIKEAGFPQTLPVSQEDMCAHCKTEALREFVRAGYRFDRIAALPEELRPDAYERRAYMLTKENVEYILLRFYKEVAEEEIPKRNYTLIMRQEDAPLAKYVLENKMYYLEKIYVPYYVSASEEVEVLTEFLNEKELRDERENKVIDGMQVKIQNASEIEWSDTLEKLLKKNKLAFTKENILEVWSKEQELTEGLRAFLAENYRDKSCGLSFVEMKNYFGETDEKHPVALKLCRQLLDIEEIDEDAFGNLVRDINICFQKLKSDSIRWSDGKMAQIIRTDTIDMTEDNLQTMRTLGRDDWLCKWIEHQLNAYFKLMEDEELREEDELQTLITRDGVGDDDKVRCINYCRRPVPMSEKYSACVIEAIAAQKLFEE